MPSSAIEAVPYLVEFIRKNNPQLKSVLDVGIGFGKDGFLLREYFDAKTYHKFQPKEWLLEITGIEIFPSYLSELQKLIYNKILIGDVFDLLPSLGNYDLAILADVIEHFPKEKGYILLDRLFQHTNDIIITTPNGFLKQARGALNNKYEEHKSGWTLDDFKRFRIEDSAVVSRIRKEEELLVVYIKK